MSPSGSSISTPPASIEQIAPRSGIWEGSFQVFNERLNTNIDLTKKCWIISAEDFKDDSRAFWGYLAPHRFVIIHVLYMAPKTESPGPVDFFVRIDRRVKPFTSTAKLTSDGGITPSNDRVAASFSKGSLLALSAKRHPESMMQLRRRPSLTKLRDLLDTFREVLPMYNLTTENCWLVSSETMKALKLLGDGEYHLGGPQDDDWAPEVSSRIDKNLQSTEFYKR